MTKLDIRLPCCCGGFEADHPNDFCTEWHRYDAFHHHPEKIPTPSTPAPTVENTVEAYELTLERLVAMKVVWPRGPGPKFFKSENHLNREIEKMLDQET